jgi:xanthine phosphoribosyltransferase
MKSKTGNIGDDCIRDGILLYAGNRQHRRFKKITFAGTDRVLIIDDFLAYGPALLGLRSDRETKGGGTYRRGVVIEKGFQEGGWILRELGVRVESLAILNHVR